MVKSRWLGFALGLVCWIAFAPACSSTSSNEATTGGAAGSGGGANNCCTARSDPGCSDTTIQACVCGVDANCCSNAWDAFCVTAAQLNCGACGSAGAGGSGGSGGFGGEPTGGSGGATTCTSVPVQPPPDCTTISVPVDASCCGTAVGTCVDSDAMGCIAGIHPACKDSWDDCCVSLAEQLGFCAIFAEAGTADGSGSGGGSSVDGGGGFAAAGAQGGGGGS